MRKSQLAAEEAINVIDGAASVVGSIADADIKVSATAGTAQDEKP